MLLVQSPKCPQAWTLFLLELYLGTSHLEWEFMTLMSLHWVCNLEIQVEHR